MRRALSLFQTTKMVLLISALIWLVPFWAKAETSTVQDSSATDQLTSVVTTNWTSPVNNLSMRVQFPSTVAFTDPIEIGLELRIDSSQQHSPPTTKAPVLEETHTTLRLTNLQTGIENEYKQPSSEDTQAGDEVDGHRLAERIGVPLSFRVDCDPREVDLARYNRDSIYVWREPRNTSVHESLPLGRYSVRVEVLVPQTEPGVWHGLLISPPFTIQVIGSGGELREQVFLFPNELRLKRGPVVGWDQGDIDTVRVETSPNHFLEYRITSEYGGHRAVGLPECPVVFLNGDLPRSFALSQLSLKPNKRIVFINGHMDLHFRFELVESILAPGRRRGCGTSDKRSKLWESDLSISLTKAQFDSLFIPESEAYDYHTIIVPRSLHLGPEDSLRFEAQDAELREVRCPRGFYIETRVSVGTDSVIRIDGPPQSPILAINHISSNSTLRLRIEAFASERNGISDILLWSGLSEISNWDRDYAVVEEFSQPKPESWPMRTYRVPSQLILTEKLELTAAPGDSIEVSLVRKPGTVLLAALITGNVCYGRFPPDLAGVPIEIASADLRGDTLTCVLDLYERPVGSMSVGSHETLWSNRYSIPLTKKLAKKLRKHLQNHGASLRNLGPNAVTFR